jgi:DAK2 domain fusion protein YloV
VTASGAQAAPTPFDLPTVLRFSELALAALGEAREEIDALNVYPVPDGDTGTNMFLTFEAAHEAARDAVLDPHGQDGAAEPDLAGVLHAFARGALTGARGNSGVILSQVVGALCRRMAAAGPDERPAQVFAEGLALATSASWAAVGRPVEGTMLSVADAAATAATEAARDGSLRLGHVIRRAAQAARVALARTPTQLRVLAEAGVVDAGGRGLCVILDAAETAVTGRRPVTGQSPYGLRSIPVPALAAVPSGDLSPEGPAYEVMFLLDADDDAVPPLREALDPLGDSLVVVGGDGLWHVHVHVDDVGAAVEAGIEAGRPHRIRVTHFAEQADRRPAAAAPRAGRTVVVVAAGAGLGELFVQAGATVVPGGHGRRPSTEQILEAVVAAGTDEVIVLPNDRESIAAAEAAARTARAQGEVRVAVIPTDAQVQGLAALAVHEPGRSFEQDIVDMTAAARHARSGAVTVAVRQAMTTAGPCEPGDVLGVIEGDFVLVGDDLEQVATGVLERLLGGGGELVTLVSGAGADDLAARCTAWLHEAHPTVDVVTYEGGQQRYPLLVGVE